MFGKKKSISALQYEVAYYGLRCPLLYRVTRKYHYRIGKGIRVCVPKGYLTNLGTIPNWLRWYVTPEEIADAAAVHDYLLQEYSNWEHYADGDEGIDVIGISDGPLCTRWMADCIFYEAMGRMRIPYLKRLSIFAAVRLFALWKGKK